MSGGVAYVLDETGDFPANVNLQMVDLEKIEGEAEVADVRRLVERHLEHTSSDRARQVLDGWDAMLPKFVKVIPKDYSACSRASRAPRSRASCGDEAIMVAFEENARDLSRVGGN